MNDASMFKRMDTKIAIGHDGTCSWKAPLATTSTCKIQVKNFPFDNQNCSLVFGSWRHPSNEITLSRCNAACVSRKHYSENGEWTLRGDYGRVVDLVEVDGNSYSSIMCGLVVSRKPMFYVMNMIVPCTIIALLSCLAFYLPANNGERVSLVMTVLLAMTVYMLIVTDTMPHTSESIPLVQRFYLLSIVETALCLLASCIVVKWHENTTPMPNWVYVVVNCGLRKLLMVQYVTGGDHQVPSSSSSKKEKKKGVVLRESLFDEIKPDVAKVGSSSSSSTPDDAPSRRVPRDWRLAAKVLNRAFLILFTLVSLATIFVTFGEYIF